MSFYSLKGSEEFVSHVGITIRLTADTWHLSLPRHDPAQNKYFASLRVIIESSQICRRLELHDPQESSQPRDLPRMPLFCTGRIRKRSQ